MINFEYFTPTKVFFGKERQKEVGSIINQYGFSKILLHYGSERIKKSGLYAEIIQSLQKAGIEYVELSGVKPNPRLSLVEEGIRLCRAQNIELILAVGGGSVIDSAKAIGSGFYYDGPVWDFFAGKAVPQKTLPVGVVLTMAAAGSEMSNSMVITKGRRFAEKRREQQCHPSFVGNFKSGAYLHRYPLIKRHAALWIL